MSNPFAGSNNSTREINKQLELTASALESRASALKISNKQLELTASALKSRASELSSLISSLRAERMHREAGKKTASRPQQARLNKMRTNPPYPESLKEMRDLAKLLPQETPAH